MQMTEEVADAVRRGAHDGIVRANRVKEGHLDPTNPPRDALDLVFSTLSATDDPNENLSPRFAYRFAEAAMAGYAARSITGDQEHPFDQATLLTFSDILRKVLNCFAHR